MKIYLIVAQRKEHYEGEYAPEVLDAIDEYGNDENAGVWITSKVNEYRNPDRADSEFEAVEVIAVEVSTKAIMERLRPTGVIPAKVLPNE
jgi:hypothetical protein